MGIRGGCDARRGVYSPQRAGILCVTVSYSTATQNEVCLGSLQSKKWCLSVRGGEKKPTSNDSRAGGLLAF